MEKDETILKEAEEEAKRIHDLEAPSTSVPPVVENTPKKGGNGKDIIIIVLIVLLVLAGVVILFATGVVGGKTKNSNKNSEKQNVVENTEKTNTENVEKPVDTPKYKEKQLTIDSNEVQTLYDLFAGSIQNEEKDDYTIKMKATIRYINLTDIQTKTCGELSNYKYQFEGEYETYFCNTGDISNISYPWGYNEPIELTPEGIEQVNNTSVKTVTLEKFNETYKKLFGTDPVEEPKSFRNGCVSIVY